MGDLTLMLPLFRSCLRYILLGYRPIYISKTTQNQPFEALGNFLESKNRQQTLNLLILKPFLGCILGYSLIEYCARSYEIKSVRDFPHDVETLIVTLGGLHQNGKWEMGDLTLLLHVTYSYRTSAKYG
jgi:hypothetical protein